ncbi:sugar ABC transporter substrate-binding protein [Pseudactinotalea sp. HY158]|uniref:sugar ABC transporter substrate-binding protein n=1 Tax=Pseudactinotalea sp. HY158 TaxID=2654547 RepID=UPI00129D21BA|nr:sugar ABC transporter substrate-binding protein [Pseudactinotalea sp. HY158]QGH68521.1 substrate-binding domain-containing protein [Pseudactinotalea sp. HY158]
MHATDFKSRTVSRAAFLALTASAALALASCSSAAGGDPTGSGSDDAGGTDDVTLVLSLRDTSNPYHADMVSGAEMFAETVGKELQVLANDGDSQKQMSQIQTLVAGGGTIALAVEPQTSSDARPIVEAVANSGGYVVTLMNKTDQDWPTDVGDNWVSHISFDNVVSGYDIATAVFDEMGGSGNIIALRGILDTPTDQQRFEGLEKALKEYPDITLLDVQTADFDRTRGFDVTTTLLNKFSGQVDGIWSSNDDMALGAVEALTAAGLVGDVPIAGVDGTPEAIQLISDGDSGFVATVSPDAAWQGAASLAIAYKAAIGELDVAGMTDEERAFNAEQFLVTAENASDFQKSPTFADLKDDIDDPFARMVSPIQR